MERPMKRLVLTISTILVLIMIAAAGCTGQETTSPPPEEVQLTVSTCVTCHTDKDMLKEVASPEVTTESEETVGEG
jgi:cytochrome c553